MVFLSFVKIGKELGRLGLISSHSGNMSVKCDDGILITRHKAMLACLEERDLVMAPFEGPCPGASSELLVHQAIYGQTNAKAILHCHPPYAVLLSLYLDEISPVDLEGRLILKKVPVVEVRDPVGSEGVARAIIPCLQEAKVAIIRGHGSFAIGEDLEEALMLSSALESSCKLLYLAMLLQGLVYKPKAGG